MAYYTTDMYPVQFSVDYPEEPRNRLTVFLRIITVIPIMIILALIGGAYTSAGGEIVDRTLETTATGGLLFAAPLLMILFRQKYPRWWFDWNLALFQFGARVWSYALLLRDEYPSTDEEQAVHLEIAYPDVEGQLNRVMPLFKWFLAIPHYIVLVFLWIAVVVVTLIAWLAILITGRYPRGMFNFVVGTIRWSQRVVAYAFMLTTDTYPPFRLNE